MTDEMVFSAIKFIENDITSLYSRWVLFCDGLTKRQLLVKGYAVSDIWLIPRSEFIPYRGPSYKKLKSLI